MLNTDVLIVNLTDESVKRKDYSHLFQKYIGGVGVGIHLLDEYVTEDADPLGPDNAIIFIQGAISTFYPIVSKTVCLFRSPLTGDLGESYAGGRLSMAMQFAGIGGLVLIGKAEKPVYLVIDGNGVQIQRTGPLSYMYSETIGRILRERHPSAPGRRSIVRIGPAGENLVRYSSINVDSLRHFGRLGGGAVMGSKNVKAFIVVGSEDFDLEEYVQDNMSYRKLYQEIWDDCVKTPVMRKYHVYGTPENVLLLNEIKGLPTRNFKYSQFENAEEISGEKFVEEYLGRRVSCNTCPVGCIHVALLREKYTDSPAGYSPADIHTISVAYDYELIYALGSNLELGNAVDILKLIEMTEKMGVDSITTGLILSWIAEAMEQGIISTNHTGGLEIKFGEVDGFLEAVRRISYRNTENKDLFWYAGEGLDVLVQIYGGAEFAISINNNPPAGYSTGPYTIFGHAVGARHSHLDNAGYSLDQKTLSKEMSADAALDWLITEEEWRDVLNSLVICLFAKQIFTLDVVTRCLKELKMNKSPDELKSIGKEIYMKKLQVKNKFGFSLDRTFNTLPKRFFKMETSHGTLNQDSIQELKDLYRSKIEERYQLKITY